MKFEYLLLHTWKEQKSDVTNSIETPTPRKECLLLYTHNDINSIETSAVWDN